MKYIPHVWLKKGMFSALSSHRRAWWGGRSHRLSSCCRGLWWMSLLLAFNEHSSAPSSAGESSYRGRKWRERFLGGREKKIWGSAEEKKATATKRKQEMWWRTNMKVPYCAKSTRATFSNNNPRLHPVSELDCSEGGKSILHFFCLYRTCALNRIA